MVIGMNKLKISDCKFDEIIFDTNHKLMIFYGESETFDLTDYRRGKLEKWLYYTPDGDVNFIQKGTRLTAPLVKYVLYDPAGEILSELVDVNYDIVDEDLYAKWPSPEED